MLQTMRHLAHSWVVKGFMLILVVSFGIWGIGDIFRGNPMQRAVATVEGTTITVSDLRREFGKSLAQVRRSLGPDLTEQQAKQFGLMDKTLDGLIDRAEIDREVERLGLDVTSRAAADWVLSQPELRNKDGSFNKDLFANIVARTQMDEKSFIEQEREAMARNILFSVLGTEGKTPDSIAGPLARARGQKRILDVVTLANDSVRDISAPDEKTLRDFYDKNPQAFTAPEYRALTIARLSSDDMAKNIDLSDDQLRKEYDARIAQFTHPERRDVLQVVVQDETKAKKIAEAARASGNLAGAAKDNGYKTVPLNLTEEKTLLPEIAKPIFALQLGDVSDPVKSTLGWHVLQLKKITPPGVSSFDDVKEQLRDTVKKDRAADESARVANQLDDELAAGHALEDIADSMKLRLVKIAAVDRDGKTQDGKEPPEFPDKTDALKAGFGQNAGETSPLIDDKNGNFIVVRTDEVIPSAVRPFEKVKDKIAAAWKEREQAKRAAAEAEKIAKTLRGGKPASSVAGQEGVEIRVSKPVSLLGDSDAAIPSSLMPQVLNMKKGEVITSESPGHQMVLRLAELVEADAGAKTPAQGKMAAEIAQHAPDELTLEYMEYLRMLAPPKINHDLMDTLRQEGG